MAQFGKRVAKADKKDLKGLEMSEWDRKNIQSLINFFEKAYPGYINHFVKQARKEVEPIKAQASWKKSDLNFSKRAAIPEELLMELKRGYPAIISDTRQFNQFLRWFPIFDLHNKGKYD